jgi:hypothetical protein
MELIVILVIQGALLSAGAWALRREWLALRRAGK